MDSQFTELRLSKYLVIGGVFGSSQEGVRIVMSTRSGHCLVVPEREWQALRDDQLEQIDASTLSDLIRARILVQKVEDELGSVIDENREAIQTSRTLVQILQPSADCQLDCGYCGQTHRKISMDGRLQSELLGKVDRRMSDAAERGEPYEELRVGWFGGEPLLAVPAMRSLTDGLRQIADTRGCVYSARVVTNGLGLSLPIAKELQEEMGVNHIEVTLDGPARTHDSRRVTKNGARGSFGAILRRLKAIANEPAVAFQISLRCNVDMANADAIPELIDLLADQDLHRRCSLYFAPVHAWGNDADKSSLDFAAFATREIEWFAQMLSRGYEVPLIPGRREIVCMAVRPDARITDAEGNEYNCSEVPYVEAYGTPNSYQTGHVSQPHDTSGLHFAEFNDEVRSNPDLPCHSCHALPVCGGSCPKSWADGVAPCPSFKLNGPERLLLQAASGSMSSGRNGSD